MESLASESGRLAARLSKLSLASARVIQSTQKRHFLPRATTTTTTPPRRPSEAESMLKLSNDQETPSTQPQDLLEIYRNRRSQQDTYLTQKQDRLQAIRHKKSVDRLMSRKWQGGDLYTPHDLTPKEIEKFKGKKQPSKDIFDALGINPLNEYKNPVLLAEFMTSGGLIKHPRETGLRPVNQRKVAKAIRRAIGMGLMPSCHVHPEMLRRRGPDVKSMQYMWR